MTNFNAVQHNQPPDEQLMEGVNVALEAMRTAARQQGLELHPPVLAMGISERVGSNWLSDTLRANMSQHNEPFRQQLNASHRLSSLNPNLVRLEELTDGDMHPHERHWLTTFVASKYGTERQLIKETNLFFGVDNYLGLFPDAPAVVLTRNPVGIASSFVKGDLFRRWQYGDRYAQMQQMVERPEFAEYGFIVANSGLSDLQKLGRLTVLNTLLLASALSNRPYVQVAYENATTDQRSVIQSISQLVLKDDSLLEGYRPPEDTGEAAQDDTFNTRRAKTTLDANLDGDEITALCRDTEAMLDEAERSLPAAAVERARSFLDTTNKAYNSIGRPPARRTKKPDAEPTRTTSLETKFIEAGKEGLSWRNILVTNSEFCAFLNDLRAAGQPNVVGGTHVFFNENMAHARGGRMHFDATSDSYRVSPGYEDHPAYWVTWTGAAAFARYTGSRLPSRDEIDDLVLNSGIDLKTVNADYRVGDALPVIEPQASADVIHQLVGNVMVWLRDGSDASESLNGPTMKYWYGAAWNTPDTMEEVRRLKGRHFTGSSRGLGIRLVRDSGIQTTPESGSEIAARIQEAFQVLSERNGSSLAQLDEAFTDLLA